MKTTLGTRGRPRATSSTLSHGKTAFRKSRSGFEIDPRTEAGPAACTMTAGDRATAATRLPMNPAPPVTIHRGGRSAVITMFSSISPTDGSRRRRAATGNRPGRTSIVARPPNRIGYRAPLASSPQPADLSYCNDFLLHLPTDARVLAEGPQGKWFCDHRRARGVGDRHAVRSRSQRLQPTYAHERGCNQSR